MRRKKEAVLDFTSLVDVTLIILFFFILFSYMETGKAKEEAEAVMAEAKTISETADERESEAKKKIAEAEKAKQEAVDELEEIKSINEKAAVNLEAMQEFGRSENAVISMEMSADGSNTEIMFFKGSELVDTVSGKASATLQSGIKVAFEKLGYSYDDPILCNFIYDSSEKGSYSAYSSVNSAFSEIRTKYRSLYISETDNSIFRKCKLSYGYLTNYEE